MLVLRLLCEQHSFSCGKRYKQAYYIFQFSVFQVKMVNHYASYEEFLDIEDLLQENIPLGKIMSGEHPRKTSCGRPHMVLYITPRDVPCQCPEDVPCQRPEDVPYRRPEDVPY